MAQTLTNLADLLWGDRSPGGGGIETTLVHSWPWAAWVTLLLLILAAGYVIAIYARERAASPGRRALLAGMRLLLVGLLVFMMYGWMQHRYRTDLPDLVIVMDDSASMQHVDHYEDDELREVVARRLRAAGLETPTRLNLAKAILLENDAALLKALEKRYNLKLYLVGGSARAHAGKDDSLVAALGDIQPDQPASRLGKGLRDVLEAQRGRPTAAVVLLTDGITTEGHSIGEVAEYARRKAVPLFPVGLGNDQSPRDVRLSDLLVDEVVFVNDLVNFDFKLTATGYQGRQARVRLRRKDRSGVLAEKTVVLGKDGRPTSVRLSYRPTEQGEFEYVVDVQPLEGEANPENNHQGRLVTVRDETIRVLLVQEYPNFEFRFLKNLLGRGLRGQAAGAEKAIELTTVLQEADLEYAQQDATAQRVFPVRREDLFQYDVVIFGDVNRSFLSQSAMDNLVEFVTQRGGGLVVLAGPRHTPLAYRDTPLADLLPFDPQTASLPNPADLLSDGFPVQPTRLGMASPQMQLAETLEASQQAWQELPGLYWLLEAPDVRPAARVLAEHPSRTGRTGQPLPVICMQFVGAGKVVFHATDESWRWSRYRGGDQLYARYWLQTLRYLSRSKLLGTGRAAELATDRQQYQHGEAVRLRVRFFDDRLAPPQDDGVTVVLEREGGKRQHLQLSRDASHRGIFDGTVSHLAEGQYRGWVASPTLDGQPPAQRFSVVAPPGEQARLEMDRADLRRAAKQTEGRFYTVDTADRLLRELPRGRQVRIEPLPPRPVWNSSLLAAAFVVLIVSEWLLRKRSGLL